MSSKLLFTRINTFLIPTLFSLLLSSKIHAQSFFDHFKKDSWDIEKSLILDSRIFPDDGDDHTNNQSMDLSAKLSASLENDVFSYKFSGIFRKGLFSSHRDVLLQEENFITKNIDNLIIKAGYQIHAWNIMEGFRVADIVNTKNYDGDFSLLEKFGELTISLEFETDNYSLSAYYFPEYQHPFWPESSSRIAPKLGNLGIDSSDIGASIWVEGNNIEGDDWGHQWALKYNHSFENLDISTYIISHMDRLQPIITVATDLKLRAHHFWVTQYGAAITKIIKNYVFKLEAAYRDFDDVTFQPISGGDILNPEDHSILALGFESGVDLLKGITSTFYLEYQAILGVDFLDSEQYSIYQNDIFVALRSDFNDVLGKELTLAFFLDLDKASEFTIAINYSQRLNDLWKINSGFRFVEAVDSSSPSGMELFRESDHVYLKMTRYF